MTRPAQWADLHKGMLADALKTLIQETRGEWDIVFNCTELATLSRITGRAPPMYMSHCMWPASNSVQVVLDMNLSELLLSATPPEEIITPFEQVLKDTARGLSEEVVKTLRMHYRPELAHLVAFKKEAVSVTVTTPSPLVLTMTMDYYVAYVEPFPEHAQPRRIFDAETLTFTQCK